LSRGLAKIAGRRPLQTRGDPISEGLFGEREASYPIVSLSVCELRHITLPRIDLQNISSQTATRRQ
jgi:hypothetical protein